MNGDREPLPVEVSRRGLLRLGLIVAVCFVLASMMPSGLVMATFSSLLTFGALASAVLAALTREPIWAGHVTRWDQSSVLLALGLIAGWIVDPEAAVEALDQIEAARAQSP